MLILLLLANIGLIIGSTSAQGTPGSKGQENATTPLNDYVDYESEPRQTTSEPSGTHYSFPFEGDRGRAGVWPTMVANGRHAGFHRRPSTPKSSAEQGVFLVEQPRNNHRRYELPRGRSHPLPQQPLEGSRPEIDKHPIFHNGRPSHSMGYSYAGYIQRQAKRYPIMMYTLVQCVPCQRAKHLLAVNYADVAAYFLELVGDEDWQRQLQVDLHRMTGQITFPYIFICGRHVGGASDLFELHQNGQLRSTLNNCT